MTGRSAVLECVRKAPGRGPDRTLPGVLMPDQLRIGEREFRSRLFLGTGKFPSGASMRGAIESSRTEVVTVALRRVNASGASEDILDFIDTDR